MESDKARRPGEIVFVLLMLGLSVWFLWQSWQISGFSKLSSPGVFPMLASLTMVISSVFILLNTLRKSEHQPSLTNIFSTRLVVMIVLVFLYIVSMPQIGFILASGLFLFASFVYLWRKSVLYSLLVTALSLGTIYVVFRVLFQVVLPRGQLLGVGF